MSSAPEAALVRACVRDILGSRTFARSGRLRAFLSYVVECELAGKANQLKGYTIGIDVFGRPTSFDAGSDPIVRVQAGKLRKLLDQYYDEEGCDTTLRIRIPLGSYAPEYESTPLAHRAPAVVDEGRLQERVPASAEARRKRNGPRGSWLPAPVSSHLALFTLLPLLLLAPPTHSDMAITSVIDARLSIEKTADPIDHTMDLPKVRVERCWPGTGGCRQLADAIETAARYYRTVNLVFDRKGMAGDSLSYKIRIEPQRGGKILYARLVHEQTGRTIHAEQLRTDDLDESAIAYEAFTFAAKALSVHGRIYLHAARLGTTSQTMICLQNSESRRIAADSCLHSPLLQASTSPPVGVKSMGVSRPLPAREL